MVEVYYHYTTPEAAQEIIRTGVIRKSIKKTKLRDDARYGNGVYLTQMEPTKTRFWIAFNNYDGRSQTVLERMIATGEHP